MHKDKTSWLIIVVVLVFIGFAMYVLLSQKSPVDQKVKGGYDVDGAVKRVLGDK